MRKKCCRHTKFKEKIINNNMKKKCFNICTVLILIKLFLITPPLEGIVGFNCDIDILFVHFVIYMHKHFSFILQFFKQISAYLLEIMSCPPLQLCFENVLSGFLSFFITCLSVRKNI